MNKIGGGYRVLRKELTVTSNGGGGFPLDDYGINPYKVISIISKTVNYYVDPPYGAEPGSPGFALIRTWASSALMPNTTINVIVYYIG